MEGSNFDLNSAVAKHYEGLASQALIPEHGLQLTKGLKMTQRTLKLIAQLL